MTKPKTTKSPRTKPNKASSNTFKKGDEVMIAVNIAGIKTYEDSVVLKVTKKGVFLDNGAGNDPSGPYNPVTGLLEDSYFGSQKIQKKRVK